ncbi:CxC2 domain-containing protein [Mycena chlorophos]|uniref:CxC2 domain-containing protein n=1 Tax=Mycena chlorophos TaxID=658473 RepID=A0A8H6TRU5_MYCCL|nr:CxC2 domain-containing protein [Mycena chlorophos]
MPPREDGRFHMGLEDDDEVEADSAIEFSRDGARVHSRMVNIEPMTKRRLDPTTATDAFAQWTPGQIAEGEDLDAVAATVSMLEWEIPPEAPGRENAGKTWNGQESAGRRPGYIARLSQMLGRGLGMVFQLGHHGRECVLPETLVRTMVVLDVRGVFVLNIRYCGCMKSLQEHNHLAQLLGNAWYPATVGQPATCATLSTLELFHMLNVVGNVTVESFVKSLEQLTDPTSSGNTPVRSYGEARVVLIHEYQDRYKEFGRMARQYDFIKTLKRAGVGHDEDGMEARQTGQLAVRCWACPRPGFNLPEGWEEREARFLYKLILALDANFRLKNRKRRNERLDLSLRNGHGYFVALEEYKNHLRDYVSEVDVSTCIAAAALMQKETRMTTGLRASGLEDVFARDTASFSGLVSVIFKRANGAYSNMDYIIMSALRDCGVPNVVLSYDIACQWKVHLLERAASIKKKTNLPNDLSTLKLEFALPVWHAVAHEPSCQAENSLTYLEGVGRTDGEGIERTTNRVYMPGVAELRAEEEEFRDSDLPAPKAEEVKLWLPSQVPKTVLSDEGEDRELRAVVCIRGLPRMEAELRRAQCRGAVAAIRARLHALIHLILHRNSQVAGQRQSTRFATLIGRMTDRRNDDAARYRNAWDAMLELEGGDFAGELQPLTDEDLSTRMEEESDAAARDALSRGGARRVRTQPGLAKEATSVSWIWFVGNAEDGEMHDSFRVQWSKAFARLTRWDEEVQLTREEMKRVLRSLRSIQNAWATRIRERPDLEVGIAAGMNAYAERQRVVHQRIGSSFYGAWSGSALDAVKVAVAEDGHIYRSLLATGVETTSVVP